MAAVDLALRALEVMESLNSAFSHLTEATS